MAEEEDKAPVAQYSPSPKETETINRVFMRFKRMQEERDKVRREFDGMTLTQYVNASMDAYNGIVSEELKATKQDWQSIIWDHKTRGKVKTAISMIVGMRPFIFITGKKKKDQEYSSDIFEVYEDSWKKENGAYKLYLQAISAVNKGTVIVEEIYNEEKVMQKQIISVDQETGKVVFKEKRVIRGGAGQVEANIVPLLDFYPNENCAEIKHDCCTVKLWSETAFRNKYGKFTNSEFVKPGSFVSGNDQANILYKSISDKKDTLIEVIRYYNEDLDEFVILANGFWINPQVGDTISPLPFDHKRLPFTKTVFELADEECFYGKSLPDLMRGEQDSTNALERLMLDQEILKGNKPILLGMGIDIESFQLYPGKPIKMTGDINQMKEMELSGASQSGFQMLQLLKGNANENTALDPTAAGVHSGRKTAYETNKLDENSRRSAGPFQLHIYKLLIDRAKLRVPNIQQFYTKPLQYSVLEDKYGKPVLNSEGKTTKTKPQYREVTVASPGRAPKWVSMKPEMKNCEFELNFIEDFEITDSRSARLENAEALLAESKANPLLNADEVTMNWLEARRSNPEKYYLKPQPQAMAFQAGQGIPPENPPQQI